jgi:hypothetical protein
VGQMLLERGDLDSARAEHETAIAVAQELGNEREVAINKGQLGTIFMLQEDLARAAECYQDTIETFERLNEPAMMAVGYHQLGVVLSRANSASARPARA